MPDPVLFQWPAAAAFGHILPKTRFYEHGDVRSVLRTRFVHEVQRITWSYILADRTIQRAGTDEVPEIQVFTIAAKLDDVSNEVLAAIDRTVHQPVIFEVASADRVRTAAAHKSLRGKSPTVGAYFTTEWQHRDATRRPLPTAPDLAGLYEALLKALLPVQTRVGETVSEATVRLDRARKLQREIVALEKKLRTEPQLNRKIELRRQIKERSTVLIELTNLVHSSKD